MALFHVKPSLWLDWSASRYMGLGIRYFFDKAKPAAGVLPAEARLE
jgi:hypothetical protein